VMRPVGESRVDYALTNAGLEAAVVRAQRRRHRIEEMFATGNGEAGLDHYEVQSWVGWHHHITLSRLSQNGLRPGLICGQFASRRVQSWA
jgi:hypothetical protein